MPTVTAKKKEEEEEEVEEEKGEEEEEEEDEEEGEKSVYIRAKSRYLGIPTINAILLLRLKL
jgi:hypothetical protein